MGAYDQAFFEAQQADSRRSAERIVPLLVDAIEPTSVVDVGCGVGTWLAAFRAAGVPDVFGLDGDYVDRTMLQIPVEQFQAADLNAPLERGRRFDLATSFEVAEHLEPDRSESLVADLVSLAPVVAFGAAIPHQGGTDHINERWQDEWATMFAEHGYRPVDLIRPAVWNDPDVQPWYAQNPLVYVAEGVNLNAAASMPLRVVHPTLYGQRLTRTLGPREVLAHAKRTARQRLS